MFTRVIAALSAILTAPYSGTLFPSDFDRNPPCKPAKPKPPQPDKRAKVKAARKQRNQK